ncbi:MAG: catechol 2,3-dioxygenase [Oceanospirillales bacterium]|nr:catechol 2,3-dioxygenase [Oceanospirillales bacterium]
MKKGVMRPGHVQIRVLDLEEAVAHYRDLLGLIEMDRDDQGRAYLKGWTEVDKFSVVLRQADEPGMDFMGFKVLNNTVLEQLESDLTAYGCAVEQIAAGELAGCGRRIRFEVPTGHRFELYAEKEQTGKWGVSNVNPEAWPMDLKGMKATRFDHCLLYGPNVEATYALFRDVLGFDLAEQVIDPEGNRVAAFLTASMKAHDIGPTRHGLTHGQTIYFFDPSGNRNEVFCGGDYHYPDHEPVTWKAEDLGKAIFYHDRVLNERFLSVLT